ncbi:uncharacterized protein DUF2520 [Ulvibacter sp. MAR_2010_11]|uniref:Rossmann-like and DUF2520 domain-containing protein n=1 Tax=Ulvibacter sp. MAR_2010_11 TaxID=1250229 RepID=UPI000C2BCABE|nr:DUF2520 domain-containing protein [Ulvibacter sp. MAR_2010_11]PKA84003.1 uncharacterized protein DUF2520 [Ulvibacter sp. MAR_2010_11]
MIRIVFIGFGNVNYHLCSTLYNMSNVSVNQIYNRNKVEIKSVLKSIPVTSQLSKIEEADIYIIGIPDDVVGSFSETLPFKNRLVVHTSGGVAMEVLSKQNRSGVFYPLQTFSKERVVDFKEIPICVEAENASDLKLLKTLGETISEKVVEINSEERAKLHLAAVFVNNFVNHLYRVGHEITSENNLQFDLLQPLIAETARKIETLTPSEAQTGPAKRNDLKTIEKHLHLLKDSSHKELYQQLTQAIQKTYGKKL